MEYSTIFSSFDSAEISIIKHLLEDHNVDHKILGEVTSGVIAGAIPTRVQVREDQIDKAKEILQEGGFLGEWKKDKVKRKKPTVSKWILIFLGVLVLLLVAFLVVWFMNPE